MLVGNYLFCDRNFLRKKLNYIKIINFTILIHNTKYVYKTWSNFSFHYQLETTYIHIVVNKN